MPKQVLTRKRSLIARIAVLAMIFSLLAVALPASATSVAINTAGPCPASTPSAGFTDIGAFDTTTQNAINCLFAFGITTGTSATTYSPNDTITRWQMALFLIRQAADHGITIPAAVNQGYTDIGAFDTATQNAINQITQLGISKGTSTTTFSPNAGVSRWQMALFIYRTGQAAGVTFSNTPGHNEFVDIGGLSAEAQTAINALTDTRPDPEGHIALGIGGSLFAPELILVRWQMALFLTRLLAADNVPAPAGVQVTITPTDTVTLASGNARAYTATFRNADGTPYTGWVSLRIADLDASDNAIPTDPSDNVDFQTLSDGLLVGGPDAAGFPGPDGVVSFVIRHDGVAAEDVRPFAWLDADADFVVDSGEATGQGGMAVFTGVPVAEADDGVDVVVDVVSTAPASDSFIAGRAAVDCGNGAGSDCAFVYDANDLFLIGAVGTDLAGFEAALNATDEVTVTNYADSAGGQSTFNITDDVDPPLLIDDPAAPVSVDAATYTIEGTGNPGFFVVIYSDIGNDGAINGPDNIVGGPTAIAADGTWSVVVPLIQNSANNHLATQRATSGGANGPLVDVPTITETPNVNPTLTGTVGANVAPSAALILSPNDTITITFSEAVESFGAVQSLAVLDTDGSTATLTCGTNVGCVLGGGGLTLTVSVTNVLTTVGGTIGGINNQADITSITGYRAVDDDGAINVAGSGAGRTFVGF